MSTHHALVTGVGGPAGMAAVSALKSRGFAVTAVDMNTVPHQADNFYQVPAAKDPGYLPELEQIMAEQGITWLFPTVSDELVSVAEHAHLLRARGITVYTGSPQAVQICNDKWETAHYLQQNGIAVPHSIPGGPNSSVNAFGFPLVSRPRIGRGGRGVTVHDAPPIVTTDPAFLWQSFLPGAEYDVLQVLHPDNPHLILAAQVFEKTVLREGRVGNAIELHPVQSDDVAELALNAAQTIGLYGPMDIDIRRDAQGVPRLLEINARIGAHTLSAPAVFDALVTLFKQGHRG